MAAKQRNFWAAEILMNSVWYRVKDRKMIQPFIKKLLINHLSKVILCRSLIFDLVDESIEKIERARRIRMEVGDIPAVKIGDGSVRRKVTVKRRTKEALQEVKEKKKKEEGSLGQRMMEWMNPVKVGKNGRGKPQ